MKELICKEPFVFPEDDEPFNLMGFTYTDRDYSDWLVRDYSHMCKYYREDKRWVMQFKHVDGAGENWLVWRGSKKDQGFLICNDLSLRMRLAAEAIKVAVGDRSGEDRKKRLIRAALVLGSTAVIKRVLAMTETVAQMSVYALPKKTIDDSCDFLDDAFLSDSEIQDFIKMKERDDSRARLMKVR